MTNNLTTAASEDDFESFKAAWSRPAELTFSRDELVELKRGLVHAQRATVKAIALIDRKLGIEERNETN